MDDKQDSERLHNAVADPSRRDFIALSVAAGLAAATGSTFAAQPVVEADVTIKTPDGTCDGKVQTRLLLEHSGFKGFQLMVVSLVMGYGWGKLLRKLPAVLENMTRGETPVNMAAPQAASK